MIHRDNRLLIAALVVLLVVMVASTLTLAVAWARMVPRCAEDVVLVGVGSFDGRSGRWSRYECGPAVDDYASTQFDVNADGLIDVLDVQAVVNAYLSGGGAAGPLPVPVQCVIEHWESEGLRLEPVPCG